MSTPGARAVAPAAPRRFTSDEAHRPTARGADREVAAPARVAWITARGDRHHHAVVIRRPACVGSPHGDEVGEHQGGGEVARGARGRSARGEGRAARGRGARGDSRGASEVYAETFPGSAARAVHRAPGDYPSGSAGDVITVEFTVCGVACVGLNGGPAFKQSEAFSFQIATDDKAETDRYGNAIVGNGGSPNTCGRCKDRWGVSWQVTPRARTDATSQRAPSRR